jgi:hypothetical protein
MKKNFKYILAGSMLLLFVDLTITACTKDKVQPAPIDSTCADTISFANDILPIMENYCTSCHNASNPSGSYDLSNYAGVTVNTGKVLGSIRQDASASSMPQGTDKIADSLIQKVYCWINQGAKNN